MPHLDHAFAYLEEFLLVALGIHRMEELAFLAFEVQLRTEGNQVGAYLLSLENMHQVVHRKALVFVAVAAGHDRVAEPFVVVVHQLKVVMSRRV